ncbi:serine/threonine protein kinase [bacterium]|nr:serine/threonine protein kinase [bacterium]MBP9811400.1 serine/threonine protein kinase [bacterium]
MDPQEFTVKQATAADLIGTRVGHAYVITGVLGVGGMGNVFRASQETIGRDVAIKFLPVEIATDATAVQRLGREAKALGLLNHPGIVTTFDFGFTEKREPYLVLELVEGKSLQTILDQDKRLEMTRALQIFVQICEAMSYAHSQGIIHRDLKPLNIMIGIREQFEFAKILDFGIVKLTSEVQQLTKSGEIWGSPFYMSPEQCTGGTVDNRSDIYSLGVVMFRCLTGEVPHRGASFPETIARKLSEYPPSFESIAPGLNLPDKLEALVLKCLQKQPDERFSSMQELRTELLKNYPNRLESEATLTYEKVDAVGSINKSEISKSETTEAQRKSVSPSPTIGSAMGSTITPKRSEKILSPEHSGIKQLLLVGLSLLILLGALTAVLFYFFQNQKNTMQSTEVKSNINSGANSSSSSNTNTNTNSNTTGGESSASPKTTANPVAEPTTNASAQVPTKYSSKPTKSVKKAVKKPTKQVKKKATSTTQVAVPTRSRTLRDILRHTGREVIQEIKPLRRLRHNDPNSFYREFGGR